ncbi:MAG TPA: carboxylesterase family protein, partial [Pseudomonadales bacterium]|nr:carboxylesterase family protein [Pseudomonadales bacterium]
AIRSDSIMNCPTLNMARIYSAHNPTWLYHFTYDVKSFTQPLAQFFLGKNSAPLGTFHATELGFVFGSPFLTSLSSDSDRIVKHIFQRSWGNFARTGNPNGDTVPQWDAFDPARDNYLDLNAAPSNKDGFRAGYCDYWLNKLDPSLR